MKNNYALIVIFFVLCTQINAQVAPQANFFDPEQNPVAMRNNTTLQLIVSEYVLAKSVTTRLGQGSKVSNMYKTKSANGTESLIFEGNYSGNEPHHFSMRITLVPDLAGKYFYISSPALICEKIGCFNCSIFEGDCIGCCPTLEGNGRAGRDLAAPLLRVPTSTD